MRRVVTKAPCEVELLPGVIIRRRGLRVRISWKQDRLDSDLMKVRRFKFGLILVLAPLFWGLTACRREAPHYSEALMVYPEAKQIYWTKFHGMDQLSYELKVDYPAADVIVWISDQLKAKGWQAREEDYRDPGLPTSNVRGWTQWADATVQPQATVDQWGGQWEDGSGDITEYFLIYKYPPGDRYTLTVHAVFTPARLAKKAPEVPQPQANAKANEEASAESFAGCYELKLGEWLPGSFGEDGEDRFSLVTPPSRIRLSLERGTKGIEKDRLLIRAIKGTAPGRGGASYWHVKSSNQVDLIWDDGSTGVALELEGRGNELRGLAHPHFSPTVIPRIAQVTARRIACDVPIAAERP